MILDELDDGEMFEYKDYIFQKTEKSKSYKIVCICLDNNDEVLLDRDILINEVKDYE